MNDKPIVNVEGDFFDNEFPPPPPEPFDDYDDDYDDDYGDGLEGYEGFGRYDGHGSHKPIGNIQIPQEYVHPVDELLFDEMGHPTNRLMELKDNGHKYLVFQNVQYGCTGEFAIYNIGHIQKRYQFYTSPILLAKRSLSGCGQSEVPNMQGWVTSEEEQAQFLAYFMLHRVMIEPGPKAIFGATNAYYTDEFLKRTGLQVAFKYQAPHDQWNDRSLSLLYADHKSLQTAIPEGYVPPKYVYMPKYWEWSEDHSKWNVKQHIRAKNVEPLGYVIQPDIDNIPLIKNQVKLGEPYKRKVRKA